MKTKKKLRAKRFGVGHVCIVAALVIWAFIIFIPFYNAVVISMMTAKGYALHPAALFPYEFSIDNYKYIMEAGGLLSAYASTIRIVVIGTIYGMTASTMMAYAFSRKNFPGKRLIFLLMVFTMFFGGGMIPTYLLIKRLGLINSRASVILMLGVSAYNIIIMKNGFEQVPSELEEAAKIDGANDIKIFWRVMLPLQKPLLATFALFTAVAYWNEWFWSGLLLNKSHLVTLMTYLRNIVNATSSDLATGNSGTGMATQNVYSMGVRMATVVATILPVMCVYPFLQKYFVKGIMIGAVKM